MEIDHIGYGVKSIERAKSKLKALGFAESGPVTDDWGRNVRIAFMKNGNYEIELVAPLDTSRPSPVDKCGGGVYGGCGPFFAEVRGEV